MKRSLNVNAPIALALLCTTAALTGCVGMGKAAEHDLEPTPQEEAVVTTEVKAALIASPDIDAAPIRVMLDGETVVLDGFAGSGAERALAGEIASSAAQGRTVDNRIEIR